jgi:Zn-dependent metalloprotease
MDWDSTSYTTDTPHCLRRTDGPKIYPGDLDGEVHDDGEIWSRALWDVNRALGRTAANRVILESQFFFTPDVSMPAAAQLTVTTARALYGARAAAKVRAAFQDRGILP